MTAAALAGLRVVEIGTLGAYAGRLLAGLGAEVQRIAADNAAPTWLDLGKETVFLDLAADPGQFVSLVSKSDVFIDCSPRGFLSRNGIEIAELRQRAPNLIVASVTPFGLTGPRAHWRGNDLIAMATGGLLHLAGCPGSPPAQPGGQQALLLAGIVTASAVLIALRARDQSGQGQRIDLSLQEVVIGALENAVGFFDLMGLDRGRSGWRVYSGEQVFYRARDGWLASRIGNRAGEFAGWLHDAGVAIEGWDPGQWHDLEYRTAHLVQFGAALEALALASSKDEFVVRAQQHRIPAASVATIPDLYRDPQLAAREFWLDIERPDGTFHRFPGAPFKLSATPWRLTRSTEYRVPSTEREVQSAECTVHSDTNAGQFSTFNLQPSTDVQHPSALPLAPSAVRLRPLRGLRVLDFTWVIAGPAATQVLADHGAEVIKIEGPNRPDGLRRVGPPRPPWTDSENGSGMFHLINGSKRSVAIDLNTAGGRGILRRLIRLVDVIVDNYGVDPFPKWGLGESDIRAINPDVIIARSSVMGRSGPRTRFVGLGYTIGPAAGLNALSGFPDDPPSGTGTAHPDYSSNPYHLLNGILAALHHRDRTGVGQTIDLSQHESTVVFAGDGFDQFAATGEIPQPNRNRHPSVVPHGVYRARGEDRWVAIACETDDDWRRLAMVIGQPDLANDLNLAIVTRRKAREDEIDRVITSWTERHTSEEAAEMLQASGVPAGAVKRTSDLLRDPHLRARAKLAQVEHPFLGKTRVNGPGFRLADSTGYLWRHSPLLGQDTETTLIELLGLGDDELAGLYVDGVL